MKLPLVEVKFDFKINGFEKYIKANAMIPCCLNKIFNSMLDILVHNINEAYIVLHMCIYQ